MGLILVTVNIENRKINMHYSHIEVMLFQIKMNSRRSSETVIFCNSKDLNEEH